MNVERDAFRTTLRVARLCLELDCNTIFQGLRYQAHFGLDLSHRNSPGILDGPYRAQDDRVHGGCCTREPCRRALI